MSDYIPRGYSRIPLLTLFALGNFALVLLSCVITVVILRLYFNLPSYISVKKNQVPYYMRVIIFGIISPLCLCKFHFRQRDEIYETIESYERFNLSIKPKKPALIKHKQSSLILRLNKFLDGAEQSASNETDEYEKYGRFILMHLRTLNKTLLLNKKQLDFEAMHKAFMADGTLPDESLGKYAESVRNIFEFAKNMYIEEWKQVALVLDRLVSLPCFVFHLIVDLFLF